MQKVIVQRWVETHRNHGVTHHGISIHPDAQALERFVRAHFKKMPWFRTPKVYAKPLGGFFEGEISDIAFEEMKRAGDGMHIFHIQI